MAFPARVNRKTRVAAEVESEHALRASFDAGARERPGAYLAHRAAVDREKAVARDLQASPARICTLYEAEQDCDTRTMGALLVATSATLHQKGPRAGLLR
jgi:hypothetical protein